jgi:hypothetical protein
MTMAVALSKCAGIKPALRWIAKSISSFVEKVATMTRSLKVQPAIANNAAIAASGVSNTTNTCRKSDRRMPGSNDNTARNANTHIHRVVGFGARGIFIQRFQNVHLRDSAVHGALLSDIIHNIVVIQRVRQLRPDEQAEKLQFHPKHT